MASIWWFGCTTCIGNSGPLPEEISEAINKNDLVAAAVLSGNRNFEGRVNADVRANYLASPPLVVAYAIAGSMQIDVAKAPLGTDQKGRKVYLRDIWPSNREIADVIRKSINKQMFTRKYGDVFKGDAEWRKISVQGGLTYQVGRSLDLCPEPALLRRHAEAQPADRGHRRRAHPRPVPRIRSRPTTSRRPDRSRRTARPANICATIRSGPRTSISTARGAAITR